MKKVKFVNSGRFVVVAPLPPEPLGSSVWGPPPTKEQADRVTRDMLNFNAKRDRHLFGNEAVRDAARKLHVSQAALP
jgi:hypothetical protein